MNRMACSMSAGRNAGGHQGGNPEPRVQFDALLLERSSLSCFERLTEQLDLYRRTGLAVIAAIIGLSVASATAAADHVPCPGCGACCLDGPIGPYCVETTPADCLLNLNGNPQAIGTDCHDFNANAVADACEPQFPLCVPTPDRLGCSHVCPGPLPCNPTKVRFGASGILVLECECDVDCFVDLTAAIPRCTTGCTLTPTPQSCQAFEQPIGDLNYLIECQCAPSGACCRGDYSCYVTNEFECTFHGGAYLGDQTTCANAQGPCCFDGDGDLLPDQCLNMNQTCCVGLLGGTFQGSSAACSGVGACCFGITGGGCVEVDKLCCDDFLGTFLGIGSVCLGDSNGNTLDDACENIATGGCCLSDFTCVTSTETACTESGGDYLGDHVPCSGVIGACCFDGDNDGLPESCVETDAACCVQALGGSFEGEGTTCGGRGACCFGFTGGGCVEVDQRCCDNILGGFLGVGTGCFGDGNMNGFDDACEIGAGCGPAPGGQFCQGLCFPNEYCAPTKYRREIDGSLSIVDCDCHSTFDPFVCRPVLGPTGGVTCSGTCDPMIAASCLLFTTGYLNGAIEYECFCADLVAPCSFNPKIHACRSACFDDALACVPDRLTSSSTDPPTIESCVCQRPEECRPIANPLTPQTCIGGCPPGTECSEFSLVDVFGNVITDCVCNPLPPQACCLPMFAVTCQVLLPSVCLSFGGTPQGTGTQCEGHGACCLPDGSCQFVDGVCCDDMGGTFLGPNSQCVGDGACCLDITDDLFQYETCQKADGACCAAMGGVFDGVGTQCELESCCLNAGLCNLLDPQCCTASGGQPGGAGSACAGIGACCLDIDDGPFQYDTCVEIDGECCGQQGGVFHGPNTTCRIQACCLGFACKELDARCCVESGGTPMGPGSDCDDEDGSGQADACEECQPILDGRACNPHACPALSQDCSPVSLFCGPGPGPLPVCIINECDCVFMFGCHVVLNQLGQPSCSGGCPFNGESCVLRGVDSDGNGTRDTFKCECVLETCVNDVDCHDFNVCSCDRCQVELGVCEHFPIEYGNVDCMGPPNQANIDDILCVLQGFTNIRLCTNADLHPPCIGNQIINLDDILAVLQAFAGFDPCGCEP